jgi:hypothetical protein
MPAELTFVLSLSFALFRCGGFWFLPHSEKSVARRGLCVNTTTTTTAPHHRPHLLSETLYPPCYYRLVFLPPSYPSQLGLDHLLLVSGSTPRHGFKAPGTLNKAPRGGQPPRVVPCPPLQPAFVQLQDGGGARGLEAAQPVVCSGHGALQPDLLEHGGQER